jgi:hypothetical protein
LTACSPAPPAGSGTTWTWMSPGKQGRLQLRPGQSRGDPVGPRPQGEGGVRVGRQALPAEHLADGPRKGRVVKWPGTRSSTRRRSGIWSASATRLAWRCRAGGRSGRTSDLGPPPWLSRGVGAA